MQWNVFIEDFNRKHITTYNIFDHYSFRKSIKEECVQYIDNKEMFIHAIEMNLNYYFWSKCEWEIILSDWPPSKKFADKKVDVAEQAKLNWEIFSEYVWEHKYEVIEGGND